LSSFIAIVANDGSCDLRKIAGMSNKLIAQGVWVGAEFKRTGKKKKDLAKKLGIDPAGVTKIIKGDRDVSAQEMGEIRAFFGGERRDLAPQKMEIIKQVDVRAGAGGGGFPYFEDLGDMISGDVVSEEWGIPSKFVRNELRAQSSTNVMLVEIRGDSMFPTLSHGDRAFVDTSHKQPSPPGVYAVWDGFGLVAKRIEIIPLTEPVRVRLVSDNKNHREYEVTLDEANIVGRIIGKVTAM
jgi:DNA-binding transcriptional regulator YdaS (Cro superfamily)